MKKQVDIEVIVKLEDCPNDPGHVHVAGVEATEVESYVDEGAGDSTTVGWTPRYAANWDATFGEKKSEPELN